MQTKEKYKLYIALCVILNILLAIKEILKITFRAITGFMLFLISLIRVAVFIWLFKPSVLNDFTSAWFLNDTSQKIEHIMKLFYFYVLFRLIVYILKHVKEPFRWNFGFYTVWQKADDIKIIKKQEVDMYNGHITSIIKTDFYRRDISDSEIAYKYEDKINIRDKNSLEIKEQIWYSDVLMTQTKVIPIGIAHQQ